MIPYDHKLECKTMNKEPSPVWSIREFEVSPKTDIDCAVYQTIIDYDGVLILMSDEYSNRDSPGVQIMNERLTLMILKLNNHE